MNEIWGTLLIFAIVAVACYTYGKSKYEQENKDE